MKRWLGRIATVLVFFLIINLSVTAVRNYTPKSEDEWAETSVAVMSEKIKDIKADIWDDILEICGYSKARKSFDSRKAKGTDTVSEAINSIFGI